MNLVEVLSVNRLINYSFQQQKIYLIHKTHNGVYDNMVNYISTNRKLLTEFLCDENTLVMHIYKYNLFTINPVRGLLSIG